MLVNLNSEPEDSEQEEEDTFKGRLRLLASRVGSVTALAKAAGIPVLLVDRNVDPTLAKPGVDFLAFIGSNFVQEGQRAADNPGWIFSIVIGRSRRPGRSGRS